MVIRYTEETGFQVQNIRFTFRKRSIKPEDKSFFLFAILERFAIAMFCKYEKLDPLTATHQ
jgi:hypothetical protein